ncbi:lytic transglycosylase domain-containing protein, partial [Escherichia coli]|nr:lytic transglycosylase domain-containing protein [Escherichia coli]
AFFNGEQPISAKGRFMLACALLARGDRASAERLVREAWRGDPFSSDTEDTAFERFGTLLTPGDIKIRMDMLLYS